MSLGDVIAFALIAGAIGTPAIHNRADLAVAVLAPATRAHSVRWSARADLDAVCNLRGEPTNVSMTPAHPMGASGWCAYTELPKRDWSLEMSQIRSQKMSPLARAFALLIAGLLLITLLVVAGAVVFNTNAHAATTTSHVAPGHGGGKH